jgi:hypothetical protein
VKNSIQTQRVTQSNIYDRTGLVEVTGIDTPSASWFVQDAILKQFLALPTYDADTVADTSTTPAQLNGFEALVGYVLDHPDSSGSSGLPAPMTAAALKASITGAGPAGLGFGGADGGGGAGGQEPKSRRMLGGNGQCR